MGLFQGTQERVRNIRGKRAISVRATEDLLYIHASNLISVFSIRFLPPDVQQVAIAVLASVVLVTRLNLSDLLKVNLRLV